MRGATADQQRKCAKPDSDHQRGSALEVDRFHVERGLSLARLWRRCEVSTEGAIVGAIVKTEEPSPIGAPT